MNTGLKASGQGTDGVPPPLSHSALADLGPPADDHLQYLLLAGRAGGQVGFGSPVNGEDLTLAGNPGANPGFINLNSPVIFGPYSGNPAATYGFSYTAVESLGVFIGGGLNFSGSITFTGATFIYESFRGAPTITAGAAPGFAAYTVLQALPALVAGPGFNPLAPLILNAGPRVSNPTAAVRTASTMSAVNFAGTVQTTLAGATMNVTNIVGIQVAPKYSTVGGSTIGFGTIRGLWAQTPAVGLFQPGAGVEGMTAYYAVDVQSLAFGGDVPKNALRSAILAATNARFLNNTGGAESEFGDGDIHLNDSTWMKYGNTLANPDVIVGWASPESAMVWSTFFGIVANPLYLHPTATDTWIFRQNQVAGGLDIGIGFNVAKVSFGAVDPNPLTTNWFVRFEAADGRQPASAGFYSDVWWTAGGLIDVNGLAMSEINSFRIDPNVTVLNGGTVQDQSTLYLAGMGFPGSGAATRLQTLRVVGRSRLDGLMTHNEASLAQLTADVAALTLPVTNSGRFVILQDADANGPWTIQGIVNDQVGDAFYIVNDGSNIFLIGHEDAGAAAADRIISPTGLDLALAPDQMAKLWYDPVATRWRILEETGFGVQRTQHLSGEQFRKGATAPTDVTIGTSPTVDALHFDAINELASLFHSLPVDLDRSQDITLRVQASLSAVETNLDTCDFTCDYTAVTLAAAGGVAKASTQITGQFTAVTGRLAIGDLYVLEFTFLAGDATNPLASAIGLAIEVHLTNVTGVGEIDLLDGDLIYTALR